jgi:hypothetical protein
VDAGQAWEVIVDAEIAMEALKSTINHRFPFTQRLTTAASS